MVTTRLRLAIFAVLAVSVACRKEQSFEDGVRAFCESPKKIAAVPPGNRAAALGAVIKADVTNPEVLRMIGELHGTPAENDGQIRRAQRRANLDSCYFLDAPDAHR